jgi:hypothetical protein
VLSVAVHNVHSRRVAADVDAAGALLDGLARSGDRLWPAQDWMPIWLDGPTEVGTTGGHGPARWRIVGHQPGRWIRCALTGPPFLVGFHEFTVRPDGPGAAVVEHLLALRLGALGWAVYPLVFRPLHDYVIEQALDRAQQHLTGSVGRSTVAGPGTRMLRWLMTRYLRWAAPNPTAVESDRS